MLISDHWFHAIFVQPSSGRERKIFDNLKKNRKKYSQKNVYIRIMYNSFLFYVCVCVCVCVDYICIWFFVVVYVIVSMGVYDDTCTAWQI